MKIILVILAGIALLGGAYLYFGTEPSQNQSMNLEENTSTNSGMRAEENMIVVNEQKPGTFVTASIVYLAAPGYVVIHEDTNGEPGAIIGSSSLLQSSENTNVRISLSRPSKDGETLHAMLHSEKGNSTFTAAEDTPVQSILGGPIHGMFEVSNEASVNVPVI